MKIPFFDLKKQCQALKPEMDAAMDEVIRDTAFSGGPYADRFEQEFARYCGVGHVAGVSNGTDALHLAVRALGIGPGDEVIIPANTFIATAWGVSHAGATPVFADCDPLTWNIDPAGIEERITERTKAVIGVHLYGQPFDVASVRGITGKRGLRLIEDCAQAHGALYRGRKAGGLGDAGCFSFYPGKNLGAYGEAGAVSTDSAGTDAAVRLLRNHGSPEKYRHDMMGFNMRMDGLQGAVLSVKLRHLDSWNARRRALAAMYLEGIDNPHITAQRALDGAESAWHLFVVMTPERDGLKRYLEANDVWPAMHYPVPCHLQKAYAHLGYRRGDFPNSERLSEQCLSLPMFPEMEDAQAERVIELLNAYRPGGTR